MEIVNVEDLGLKVHIHSKIPPDESCVDQYLRDGPFHRY